MTAWTDISRSRSARVRRLDTWWQSSAGGGLPDRANFDPALFAELLPYLLISEAERPFRVRFRLIGTAVCEVAGNDFSGRYLDEILPDGEGEEPWLAHYRTSFDTRRPLYGGCRIPTVSGGQIDYEFGIWPLAQGGSDVRQFIGVEDFGDWRGRVRPLREEIANWKVALRQAR